jgi:hypothetical protein
VRPGRRRPGRGGKLDPTSLRSIHLRDEGCSR